MDTSKLSSEIIDHMAVVHLGFTVTALWLERQSVSPGKDAPQMTIPARRDPAAEALQLAALRALAGQPPV